MIQNEICPNCQDNFTVDVLLAKDVVSSCYGMATQEEYDAAVALVEKSKKGASFPLSLKVETTVRMSRGHLIIQVHTFCPICELRTNVSFETKRLSLLSYEPRDLEEGE